MGRRRSRGASDGDGLWTTAANWNPDAVPAGVSAEINLNNADVALNDGSTQTIAGLQLAVPNNVTATLSVSNGSTINVNGGLNMATGGTGSNATLTLTNSTFNGVNGGEWVRRGGLAAVTMTNSTINAINGLAWAGANAAEGADRLNISMSDSTINLTSGSLTIGQNRNDQRVTFTTFSADSQLNVTAGSMILRGGNPSGPGGHAVYNIPLTTTAAADGKFFINNGVTQVASGTNNRVTLDLDAAGTLGKLQSDAALNWKGNGISIASGPDSIGIVNLNGITISNLGNTEIGRRSNANGTINMVNSTINKSGGTNLAMESTGSRGTLSLTNSIYNESGQIIVGNGTGVGNNGFATFTLIGNSQINITASNLRLNGGNPSALGGIAVYDLPMAATVNTNGKIYAHQGLHIASSDNNRVRVNLSNTTSDANLNWNNAAMVVGEGINSIGQLYLDGVNISGINFGAIGRRNGANAILSITDATVNKNVAGSDFFVAYSEGSPSGQVILDNGNLTVSANNLRNRGITSGSAEIRGTGNVSVTAGSLVQDGRIVADGGVLSVTASGGVTSSNFAVAQANYGQAGLYAVNTGRLNMPNLTVAANTPTTWGEEAGDASPDFVNSVRFTSLAGMAGSQTLSGAVLAPDNAGVPAGLVNPISIWDFSGLTFDSATMLVRYDDSLAASLLVDENDLKLFHYEGGLWNDITDVLNIGANTISSDVFNSLSPFAVATDAINPSAVPEPSTYALGLLGMVGFGWFVWRKRRNRG